MLGEGGGDGLSGAHQDGLFSVKPSLATSTSALGAHCATRTVDTKQSGTTVVESLFHDSVPLTDRILDGSRGLKGAAVENHARSCPKPPAMSPIEVVAAPMADRLAISTATETSASVMEDGTFHQKSAVLPVHVRSENLDLSGSTLEEAERERGVLSEWKDGYDIVRSNFSGTHSSDYSDGSACLNPMRDREESDAKNICSEILSDDCLDGTSPSTAIGMFSGKGVIDH